MNSVEIKEGSHFHWGYETKKHEDIVESRKKNKKKVKKEKKAKKVAEGEELLLANKGIESEKLEEPKKEFILKNLNLSIKKGDFVCIIGAVGSGKSSLLSTLIGDMMYSAEPEINPYSPVAEYSSNPIMINQNLAYS